MDARTAEASLRFPAEAVRGQAAATGLGGFMLALRFALRELRGGLRGFYVFLTCIALGVAAISGVNSVASSITSGIAEEGQKILGGDVSASLVQRELDGDQLAFLESYGTVSKSTTLRTMARKLDGSDQTLVELKAVDNAYPLYGALTGEAGPFRPQTLAGKAVVMEGLLGERLGLKAGERLKIGNAEFTIADVIVSEPDRLGEDFGFGPRVLMSMEGLEVASSPTGPFMYRAADNQSTMGAYVGKTTVKDGKPMMTDWFYADGADYLPSEEEAAKLRPAE